jgi:hypothetical protein
MSNIVVVNRFCVGVKFGEAPAHRPPQQDEQRKELLKHRKRKIVVPTALYCWVATVLLGSQILPIVECRRTRVTWVNGIAHRLDHMLEGQACISKLFGGTPIIYCHNRSAMKSDQDNIGYLTDLSQAGQQKYFGFITEEVDSLVVHLRKALAYVGKRGCVIHIAHSQGALITSLASKQLRPDEMEQIEILGFGGAAAIRRTKQTPFKRCINYYSINDPLLMIVPVAAQALRSGLVGTDSEFCFLAPRIGDPVRDHHLWGPTYASALKWEGDRFQRMYMNPITRLSRFLIRVLVLSFLHVLVTIVESGFWLVRAIVLLVWRSMLRCCQLAKAITDTTVVQPSIVTTRFLIRATSVIVSSWRGDERFVPVPNDFAPPGKESVGDNSAASSR